MPESAQQFVVTHDKDEAYKGDGLRAFAEYRDLQMAEATHGLVHAHVSRKSKPYTPDVTQWHKHELQFQMVYCLKGWMKIALEGHGEHLMTAGSCWIQPAGVAHAVTDYSEDSAVLEITMPANYSTISVPGPTADSTSEG